MDEIAEQPQTSKVVIRTFVIVVIVAFVLAIFVTSMYFYNFNGNLSSSNGDWGTFGDFVGGSLNPIFAFLGLIALLLTIILQSKELQNSTNELARSTSALKKQGELLDKQNFENTFFQMVKLHNDIINAIDLRKRSNNELLAQGRDCFKKFYERFQYKYSVSSKDLSSEGDLTIIEDSYTKFFNEKQHEIGHYFRNLYVIFKFIDESNIEDKKQYTRIIRAQLSTYEQALLFYNCLHSIGNRKFKPLIEKYELLENLDLDLLIQREKHISLYEKNAYGDQTI